MILRWNSKKWVRGFTLVEFMFSMSILVVLLVSLLVAYVSCFELIETSRNTTLMINIAQKKLEEIKNANFTSVPAYAKSPQTPFYPDYLIGNSIGAISVDTSDPNLLNVRVSICWRQKGGRIIGEDKNLNGRLDSGEDSDLDQLVSSPVSVTTLISQ